MNWQLQDAKARFSEIIEATLRDGPQWITRRGKETAVLVSAEQWRRTREGARRGLKDLLLAPDSRFELTIPPRGRLRSRTKR